MSKKIFLMLFLPVIFLWIFYYLHYKNVIIAPGGMEQADIARNIYKRKGFISGLGMPYKIGLLTEKRGSEKVLFFPSKDGLFQPFIISLFFHLFGATTQAVILVSMFFYIGIILLTFFIASRIFSENTATISAFLVGTNLTLIQWSAWGSPELIFFFLFLLSIYFLISKRNFLLVGICFGFCQLARIQAFFYLVPFVIYIYLAEKSIKKVGIFLLGFLLAVIPIYIFYNYVGSGVSIFEEIGNYLVFSTQSFPGHNAWRITKAISLFEFIKYYPVDLIMKIRSSIYYFIEFFLLLTSPFLMAFFVSSIFLIYKVKERNLFKYFLYLLFIFGLFFHSLTTGYHDRYFYHLIPLVIIAASDFILELFKNINKKMLFGSILIFLILFPTIMDVYNISLGKSDIKKTEMLRNYIGKFTKENTKEGDILVSDRPWIINWYGERKCFVLPLTVDDLEILIEKINPAGIIISFIAIFYDYDSKSQWIAKYDTMGKEDLSIDMFKGKIKLNNFEENRIKEKEFEILFLKREQ